MTVNSTPNTPASFSLPVADRRAWQIAFWTAGVYAVITVAAIFTVQAVVPWFVVPNLVPVALAVLAAIAMWTSRRVRAFALLSAAAVAAFLWHGFLFFAMTANNPLGVIPGTTTIAFLAEDHDIPLIVLDLGFYLVLVAAIAAYFASRTLRAAAAPKPAGATSGRLSVFAVLALVFSIVIAPVGVIFGHIALSEIRRSGDRGRGLAIAGLVIGYAWTLTIVIIAVVGFGGG